MDTAIFRKANQLKDDLNQILEKFIDVAEYWIEIENSGIDLILLKVSLKSNLQQTLDQISGDISGSITYEIEIEDFDSRGNEKEMTFTYVETQTPDFQKIYEDVDQIETILNRPFIKEISVEDEYAEADSMNKVEERAEFKLNRDSYEKVNVYNLSRIMKIKVIDDLL